MAKQYAGKVKLLDVGGYLNLEAAAGLVVPCTVHDWEDGDFTYYVEPEVFTKLGCHVGGCSQPFPFYEGEVEVITEE
jgi:hypothetical protein